MTRITIRSGTGTPKGTVEIVGRVHIGARVTHNHDARFGYVVVLGADGAFYETKSRGGGYRRAKSQERAAEAYRRALEQRARVLLATVPGGATPGRVAKLAAVLAEHPRVQLETCADERTGARYGEAACRTGRAVKVGYRTHHYQIWAVWPKEQT